MMALLLVTGIGLQGQTNAPQVRRLSLEDCIQIALEHNFNVQIQRLNPDLARYSLNATYGAYDPNFSFSGEHASSQSPGGYDELGRLYGGTDTETDTFSTGIGGLLPWGSSYSIGGRLSDTRGTSPSIRSGDPFVVTNSYVDINTGNTISYLSTNFTMVPVIDPFTSVNGSVGLFQFRQPLLRNSWIDSTRLQIFINKKNLQISELELRAQIMSTVTAVEQAYYNLILDQETVKVQKKALELADRLLAENRKRVEVGALAPLDEKQAESQAAASRADLLAAEIAEDTQQRVMKNLLSDDYSQWQNVTIQPAEALIAVPEQFDLQESWRRGLSQRPDVLQQTLALEKQGYIVKFQKNQLFPQLDVVGTAGLNAASRRGTSDVFEQVGELENPFWSVGGQLSIPLGNRVARNNYRAARTTREQIELQLKQLQQGVLIQIENAIAVARTAFQRVNATREARIYAEAALEAEQRKLESGKSTSFEVLRLQRDLTAARSSEIRALADYNTALAQISLNEGGTLDRRKVKLEVK